MPSVIDARKAAAGAKDRVDAGVEFVAGLGVKDERGKEPEPGAAAFDPAHQNSMCGAIGARVDREDVEGAKTPAGRGKKHFQPVGAIDDGDIAPEFQHRRSGPEPGIEAAGAEDVGIGASRFRRLGAQCRTVEGRVEEDMLGEAATHPRLDPLRFGRGDVDWNDAHAVGEGRIGRSKQRRPRAGDRLGIPLDEHHPRPLAACGRAEPGDAYFGAKVDDRAGDAGIEEAARSTASRPAR